MTQRQKFTLLNDYGSFQLREYEPCVLAEVTINSEYDSASNRAFGTLFNYIAKGNSTSTKIAMTAPVIAATSESLDSTKWHISFVMPAGSTRQDMPDPNNSSVVLREISQEKCLALSFRGRGSKELWQKKEEELRSLAKREGIALSEEVRICRFDPPFKPGFLHYNEVVIPLA